MALVLEADEERVVGPGLHEVGHDQVARDEVVDLPVGDDGLAFGFPEARLVVQIEEGRPDAEGDLQLRVGVGRWLQRG